MNKYSVPLGAVAAEKPTLADYLDLNMDIYSKFENVPLADFGKYADYLLDMCEEIDGT